jgi:hypothetical protein
VFRGERKEVAVMKATRKGEKEKERKNHQSPETTNKKSVLGIRWRGETTCTYASEHLSLMFLQYRSFLPSVPLYFFLRFTKEKRFAL